MHNHIFVDFTLIHTFKTNYLDLYLNSNLLNTRKIRNTYFYNYVISLKTQVPAVLQLTN